MTENDRLTEKRDGQNVIPLRQDGKTKWSLASAGMGDASTQFLYGTHADKLADYEAIGTVEEIQQKLKNMSLVIDTDRDLLNRYIAIGTIEEFKALKEKNTPNKVIDIGKSECPEDIEYFGADELFGTCPHCQGMVNNTWNPCSCGDCGGLIDWSE